MRRKILLLMNLLLAAFAAQAAVKTVTDNGLKYQYDTSKNIGTSTAPAYEATLVADDTKYTGDITVPRAFVIVEKGKTTGFSVTAIGDEAFSYCTGLTSINMSAATNLKTIGTNAFRSCNKLTTISLPSKVETIGQGAFASCSKLESITLSSNLKEISSQAFAYAESLRSIKIPSKVTKIRYEAFAKCTALTSVEFAAVNIEFEQNPFVLCDNLTNITADSNSNLYVKNNCLVTTDGLLVVALNKQSIDVPEGVKRIHLLAFANSSSMKSLTLPSTLTTIASRAFEYNCENLELVTCNSIAPPTFDNLSFPSTVCNNAILKVPYGRKSNYNSHHGWKNFKNIQELDEFEVDGIRYHITSTGSTLTCEVMKRNEGYIYDIVVPETVSFGGSTFSVTGVKDEAFNQCFSLNSVQLPQTVKVGSINS